MQQINLNKWIDEDIAWKQIVAQDANDKFLANLTIWLDKRIVDINTHYSKYELNLLLEHITDETLEAARKLIVKYDVTMQQAVEHKYKRPVMRFHDERTAQYFERDGFWSDQEGSKQTFVPPEKIMAPTNTSDILNNFVCVMFELTNKVDNISMNELTQQETNVRIESALECLVNDIEWIRNRDESRNGPCCDIYYICGVIIIVGVYLAIQFGICKSAM